MMGRSKSEWGPWEACPANPILTHSGMESPIQNTGHGDLIEDGEGNWWIVFLGVRTQSYPPVHILGRETFIAAVQWTADGWPVINEGQPIALPNVAEETSSEWLDEFAADQLHERWVTIGRSYRDVYRIDGGAGLQLIAQSQSLSAIGKVGWIGTRFREHETRFEMSFELETPETETGIAAYMESTGYYSLGVRQINSERSVLRLTKHSLRISNRFRGDHRLTTAPCFADGTERPRGVRLQSAHLLGEDRTG